MMQLVQAGNAAQQATAEAEKAKLLDEAVTKATQEKTNKIAALEAKLNKKKAADAYTKFEADTEPDEGEDEDGADTVVKASRGQKHKAKQKDKAALAQAEKAELELELAKARTETELARQEATYTDENNDQPPWGGGGQHPSYSFLV